MGRIGRKEKPHKFSFFIFFPVFQVFTLNFIWLMTQYVHNLMVAQLVINLGVGFWMYLMITFVAFLCFTDIIKYQTHLFFFCFQFATPFIRNHRRRKTKEARRDLIYKVKKKLAINLHLRYWSCKSIGKVQKCLHNAELLGLL